MTHVDATGSRDSQRSPVAMLGSGVIGAGWAARWCLHGHPVRVFDPGLTNRARLDGVLQRARSSLGPLHDDLLPIEAPVTVAASLAEAVDGVCWVQESVPEQLDLKHAVLTDVETFAPADAIVASSTSGFRPTVLAEPMRHPERFVVAHPFNPVYLLPAVEIVAGEATDEDIVEQAIRQLGALGMKPLRVRREIDAHVADRLMEALWREALWLVRDGVATTEEVDDLIRYGFGLRWAQMGLFETFRIAGGDAGMRHFLEQFGPALAWPWSRLTDVPEFDAALVETIASQSDRQSGARPVSELEAIRDRNLVAMMRALRHENWGAGAHVAAHVDRLRRAGDPTSESPDGHFSVEAEAAPTPDIDQ